MTGVQTCALPICFPVTIRGVTVRPDNGYDALASVDINPVLESKVVNVTSNGTTSVLTDQYQTDFGAADCCAGVSKLRDIFCTSVYYNDEVFKNTR